MKCAIVHMRIHNTTTLIHTFVISSNLLKCPITFCLTKLPKIMWVKKKMFFLVLLLQQTILYHLRKNNFHGRSFMFDKEIKLVFDLNKYISIGTILNIHFIALNIEYKNFRIFTKCEKST